MMIASLKRWLGTALMLLVGGGIAIAQDGADSPRIALVVGIDAYRSAPLSTAANDAGLIAQTLAAAGFDVTAARDPDGATLRQAVRDFLDKAATGGPRGIAAVYLAGRAVQVDGENYFAPADAHLERAASIPIDSVRIADLTRALAATNLGAKVVIIDGAHADAPASGSFEGGLALVDASAGTLLAFNAAPGTVFPSEPGPYGTYARILAQTMRQGGVPVDEVFDRVRVAVNSETRGGAVPWDVSKLLQSFTFFDRAANAPAMGSAQVPFTSLRTRPLRDFSPEQAYDVAVARDTIPAYQDYLGVFPDHPLARRIRLILAVRREAQFWRAAVRADAPPAYWTYLRRYPDGPHVGDAQRRLARLAAGRTPPPGFAPLGFDVPPPTVEELQVFDHRRAVSDADVPPPPPPPLFLLPPVPPEDRLLQPPPPSPGPRLLPVPLAVAIPFVRPIIAPGMIVPPRGVSGAYRQPRPFAAGATDGGLVPRFIGGQPDPDTLHTRATPAPTVVQGTVSAPAPGSATPLPPSPSAPPRPAPRSGRLPAIPADGTHPGTVPPLVQSQHQGSAAGGKAHPLPDPNGGEATPPGEAPESMPKAGAPTRHLDQGKFGRPPATEPPAVPRPRSPAVPPPVMPTLPAPPRVTPALSPRSIPEAPARLQQAPPPPNLVPRTPPPQPAPAPRLPAASSKSPAPTQRPALPLGDGAAPHAAAQDHRARPPECGRSGQPPCRP